MSSEIQQQIENFVKMNTLIILIILTNLCDVFNANCVSQISIDGSIKNCQNATWKSTDWLKVSELESLPALNKMSLRLFETMTAEDCSAMLYKIYNLIQLSRDVGPRWSPALDVIPSYIVAPNGEKVSFKLNQLVSTLKQLPYFDNQEVTIYLSGLTEIYSEYVKESNRKLAEAYWQRYNYQQQCNDNKQPWETQDSSEQTVLQCNKYEQNSTGIFLVFDIASTVFKSAHFFLFDFELIGTEIGKLLVQLTNEADVPHELIHCIGHGFGAHVAGHAARLYTRLTGHKLHRITGLDPSKIYSHTTSNLIGLARGDAEFVDVIHTSGLGTSERVGDVDFYPNGLSASVPGAHNIVEASMLSVRYFAESVHPGNERNFPAASANSLEEYENSDDYSQRNNMGIDTNFNLEGDYFLRVNSESPYGKRAPKNKLNTLVRR